MTTPTDKTALENAKEAVRREAIRGKRRAVRAGARRYACLRNVRFDALWKLGISPSDHTLDDLKKQLRAQIQAKASGSWRYSLPRYIAVLQALNGEMLWLEGQPAREALRAQRENRAIAKFVSTNQQPAE